MPKLAIERGYFETRAQVMEDVRDTGYWPAPTSPTPRPSFRSTTTTTTSSAT